MEPGLRYRVGGGSVTLPKNASTTAGSTSMISLAMPTMGFVMYFLKRFLVGGVHQAKRLRSDLVMPVCYETDAIFALDRQILHMRRDNVLASDVLPCCGGPCKSAFDSSPMIGNGVLADRKLA